MTAFSHPRMPVLAEGYIHTNFNCLSYRQRGDYELAMRDLLEPLYGPQDAALDKIRQGHDRTAEVLIHIASGRQVGTLVYKNELQTERYWNLFNGDDRLVTNALEVKTLALFDEETDGGLGLGSWLAARAEHIGREVGARGIVLTVQNGNYFDRKHGYSGVIYMPETSRQETSGAVMHKKLSAH